MPVKGFYVQMQPSKQQEEQMSEDKQSHSKQVNFFL